MAELLRPDRYPTHCSACRSANVIIDQQAGDVVCRSCGTVLKDRLEVDDSCTRLENTGGELQHLISDAATMQIIRWTRGGFGMSAHNYDGDMLTDEVAQVHRSPGFITSNLVGVAADGSPVYISVSFHTYCRVDGVEAIEQMVSRRRRSEPDFSSPRHRRDPAGASAISPVRDHTDQGVRGLARHGF